MIMSKRVKSVLSNLLKEILVIIGQIFWLSELTIRFYLNPNIWGSLGTLGDTTGSQRIHLPLKIGKVGES